MFDITQLNYRPKFFVMVVSSRLSSQALGCLFSRKYSLSPLYQMVPVHLLLLIFIFTVNCTVRSASAFGRALHEVLSSLKLRTKPFSCMPGQRTILIQWDAGVPLAGGRSAPAAHRVHGLEASDRRVYRLSSRPDVISSDRRPTRLIGSKIWKALHASRQNKANWTGRSSWDAFRRTFLYTVRNTTAVVC